MSDDKTNNNDARRIVIAGGIGAGKSVVSRILRLKGYSVYCCDSEAKRLMESDVEFKRDLKELLGKECLTETGGLNSKAIARVVFSDKEKLQWLNCRTHAMVRHDILRFINKRSREGIIFFESAIPATSGLIDICDEIWFVSASEDIRVTRAMCRGHGMRREDVVARLNAQKKEEEMCRESDRSFYEIINDNDTSLLGQIDGLLK